VKPILLGDIGGTNARFALLRDGVIGPLERLQTGDFPTSEAAIDRVLAEHGGDADLGGIALAVAGPIDAGRASLTNSHWVLDAEALRRRYKLRSAQLVNDFEATAWSLPHLTPDFLVPLGGGQRDREQPAVAMGPGTGLGVACYIPGPKGARVLPGEGGHATLPASDEREAAVIAVLRKTFGHASIERALSGEGLVNLYRALAALDGAAVQERSPQQITEAALAGNGPYCGAAVRMFCSMLGNVAGNLALTIRSAGGVFLAGGILPHLIGYLPGTNFRERFEEKGRFRPWLREVPVFVITHPESAMVGLKSLVEND
jgi:glucokinase